MRIAVGGFHIECSNYNPSLTRTEDFRIDGIALVVTARRRLFHNVEDFTRLGLAPHAAAIVTVKSGYLSSEMARHRQPLAHGASPGVVDQAVERFPRDRTRRLTYPFDTDFTFAPRVYWSARSNG